MGRTKGLTTLVCDRCGTKDTFNEETDPKKNTWYDIKRYTSIGGDPTSNLLCSDCNKLYRALLASQDNEFNTFMSNTTKEA